VESAKLDALLAYCETASCRRVVLLEYLGERAGPCGNCDTCSQPPAMWDATIPAQKFLSGTIRTGQRFGAGHIIDLLLGRRTERMTTLGHDALPTFGVGADLDEHTWRSVARQLVAQGLLTSDAGAHGALRVTETAGPVLSGQAHVELRRSPPRTGRGRTPSPSRNSAASVSLDSDGDALFALLRTERKAMADEQGVPAYVVLHDTTLREIAARRPTSVAELLAVPGIGTAKADRYGERILTLLSRSSAQ
jgi:ATP-dependent DNA helicase RecQ